MPHLGARHWRQASPEHSGDCESAFRVRAGDQSHEDGGEGREGEQEDVTMLGEFLINFSNGDGRGVLRALGSFFRDSFQFKFP